MVEYYNNADRARSRRGRQRENQCPTSSLPFVPHASAADLLVVDATAVVVGCLSGAAFTA